MSLKTFLQKLGADFKKGLDEILPYAETVGETAVSIFAPALGPMFNQTVSAVVTAEQNAEALGQTKAGASKLAAVVSIAGGLIKQGLSDAGLASDEAAVTGYINSVVTILNSAPAPAAPASGS